MAPAADVVAAALGRWVWIPEGATVVETDDWLLLRYPDWAYTPLVLTRFTPVGDPTRALAAALDEARSLAPDLESLQAVCGLASPAGTERVLAAADGVLVEDAEVLALDLGDGPPDLGEAVAGVEIRWATTPEVALEFNAASVAVFDVPVMTAERAATVAGENAAKLAEGRGAAAVALLDGRPVGTGGLELDGSDARLYGGGVRAEVRGRGVYRALLRHRLDHAVEHGATLALTRGRVATSAPILRRVGFEAVGTERTYRVPLR